MNPQSPNMRTPQNHCFKLTSFGHHNQSKRNPTINPTPSRHKPPQATNTIPNPSLLQYSQSQPAAKESNQFTARQLFSNLKKNNGECKRRRKSGYAQGKMEKAACESEREGKKMRETRAK
ncbi:hypothetical protein Droror1_Dr00019652 [Drosera rotundifolia]